MDDSNSVTAKKATAGTGQTKAPARVYQMSDGWVKA